MSSGKLLPPNGVFLNLPLIGNLPARFSSSLPSDLARNSLSGRSSPSSPCSDWLAVIFYHSDRLLPLFLANLLRQPGLAANMLRNGWLNYLKNQEDSISEENKNQQQTCSLPLDSGTMLGYGFLLGLDQAVDQPASGLVLLNDLVYWLSAIQLR
ncbi:unnamed protein product [Protopolystoma xenopodis]|uniref:Uncharacterized protein n=1 Tax=Protopolystoma xenopodis TaxID=117903 RepID=A0A3S5A753_9PLAT|nr:unnamed protein product [Protopolystoma xenopodis]